MCAPAPLSALLPDDFQAPGGIIPHGEGAGRGALARRARLHGNGAGGPALREPVSLPWEAAFVPCEAVSVPWEAVSVSGEAVPLPREAVSLPQEPPWCWRRRRTVLLRPAAVTATATPGGASSSSPAGAADPARRVPGEQGMLVRMFPAAPPAVRVRGSVYVCVF